MRPLSNKHQYAESQIDNLQNSTQELNGSLERWKSDNEELSGH